MELKNLAEIEHATIGARQEFLRLGTAILFLVGILIYAGVMFRDVSDAYILVAAAMVGGYMAMNIGANDVANNVGPAVGSKTLTLTGAIIIAAIFEAAGALIAGGDVVGTIKNGIINPDMVADPDTFIWLMLAALMAGALWLNIATYNGWPVSTTHSIVGGVLGAGIAAAGWDVANWSKMGAIVASWVISPVMGGVIAAIFLFIIKRTITYQADVLASARKVVPILIAVMAMAFTTYLMLKGVKKLIKVDMVTALAIGVAAGVFIWAVIRPMIAKRSLTLEADKHGVNKLFVIPLIFAAALLSFAHGANDVANAVGPLAGIYDAVMSHAVTGKASIPLWVMMIGATGIAFGLALYGPKLIRTVGSEITELDQARAFCIAMAAAITVIIASQLGLPVSSTHIAIGAVFGVGFMREAIKKNYAMILAEIREHHQGEDAQVVKDYLAKFEAAALTEKQEMMKTLRQQVKKGATTITKEERKDLNKQVTKALVQRSMALKIASAWIITVPLSALMAAMLYFTIRGFMLP
ncbi:MAG: inorganic phosphate transporter [Alphaproteobacteria bacterium]|nr:inorganic phosphate transporter [Alphaproteobacteria bacterium]